MRRARTVLGASVVAIAPSLAATDAPSPRSARTGTTTTPAHQPTTPIRHFVTVLQENHSFDNYFGTFPGVDGIPPHVCVPVDPAAPRPRPCVAPYPLEGKAVPRLTFNHKVLTTAVNGGKLDGFITAQSAGGVAEHGAMGTYNASTLTYYWELAHRYALFDRFFSSSYGGTLWNHLAWMTGSNGSLPDERIPRGRPRCEHDLRPTPVGRGELEDLRRELQPEGHDHRHQGLEQDPTLEGAGAGDAPVRRRPRAHVTRRAVDPVLPRRGERAPPGGVLRRAVRLQRAPPQPTAAAVRS